MSELIIKEAVNRVIESLAELHHLMRNTGVVKVAANWKMYSAIGDLVDKALIVGLQHAKTRGVDKPMYAIGGELFRRSNEMGATGREFKEDVEYSLVELAAARFVDTVHYYDRYNKDPKDSVAAHIMLDRGLLRRGGNGTKHS